MKIPNPFRFVSAVFRTFWFRAAGYETLVSETDEHHRLFWCHRCPKLDRDFMQCQVCTCWVPAKAKLAAEACPRGLWGAIWKKRS